MSHNPINYLTNGRLAAAIDWPTLLVCSFGNSISNDSENFLL